MKTPRYYLIVGTTAEGAPLELGSWYSGAPGTWIEINGNITLGLRVKQEVSELVIELSKLSGVLDFWWGGRLMSRRALKEVKQLGDTHFQEWTARLVTRSGKIDTETIRQVNVIDNVDCLDRKASKFKLDNNKIIYDLKRIVIAEKKVPSGRHLFRLLDLENIYVASAELVEAWQAINIRGARFIAPEEYQP